MLEVLVGLTIGRLPPTFQLLRIDCPEGLSQAHFPSTLAPPMTESRRWGDDWLRAGDTALACVPSAVAPHACNWLINPAHQAAQTIRVVAKGRWPWDKRLSR